MPVNWFAKLKSVKFSVVILIAQAFLLVNAPLFLKSGEVQSFRFLILTYMALLVGFEAFIGEGVFKARSFSGGLFWFAVGLVGGSIVLTGGKFVTSLESFQISQSAPLLLLITQATVVAASEEMIFRNYLPAAIGVVPAQLAFAAFHATAYGLALQPILTALVAGFVFYFLARFTSLWASVGCHCAWNLWAIGVLSMLGVA